MDPRTAASQPPDPDAIAFVRFCYHRRRVGWPELYDEMCAVAHRGLYRGYGPDELADIGIGFGLFEMPALAALANRVVEQERASRRPVTVVITEAVESFEAPLAVATPVAAETLPVAAATVAAMTAAVEADVEGHALAVSAADDPVALPAPVSSRPVVEEPPRPEPGIRFVPVPAGA
jgi:hypothetical protein